MSAQVAMLSALNKIERIRDRLHALPRDNAEGWKRQYVGIRRELQAEFTLFNQACTAWLADAADDGDARRLRELAGAFRSRLAEHQSRFPVVSIDPADAAYWSSMNATDASRRDLVALVRTLK